MGEIIRRLSGWTVRGFCMLLSMTLLILWPVAAHMESAFSSGGERLQIVRVRLARLGITERMDITLDGMYGLGRQGEANMLFERGSPLTILLQNGSLVVYYRGMAYQAGASLYLTRYAAPDGLENGIRIAGAPALYLGDMQLDVENGVIRPVLYIHIEDYLRGVVPHEMSNTFPLEALKAQAVTARTYALRRQDSAKP
ncbi:MAG: SpoIID/LytB domain-containing protein, partial [Clostridia bacterium]|nr:SpoIID/LytB domain-containing protein [Clostridia bacterium]